MHHAIGCCEIWKWQERTTDGHITYKKKYIYTSILYLTSRLIRCALLLEGIVLNYEKLTIEQSELFLRTQLMRSAIIKSFEQIKRL